MISSDHRILQKKLQNISINYNNTLLNNDSSKCEAFATNFCKVHSQNVNLGEQEHNNLVDSFYSNIMNNQADTSLTNFTEFNPSHNPNINSHFTSPKKLINIIDSLKNKKSAGFDQISNQMIKKLPLNTITTLSIIYNNIINNSYYPKSWKNSIIIPILKPNKTESDITNYRPISLLSCLSKLLEIIFLQKINIFIEDNNILPQYQFGFRNFHSTSHALDIFSNDINNSLNKKHINIACALDIKKAFDTVWHAGLIFKLKNMFHIDDHLLQFLINFLNDRTSQVRINNTLSEKYSIKAGVPQGAIISPIFYSIYTADTPPINTQDSKILLYADDALVYFNNKKILKTIHSMNSYLHNLSAYYNKWKIKINENKCEYIIIHPPFNKCASITVKTLKEANRNNLIEINYKFIKNTNVLKYLGINFNYKFNYIDHVKTLLKRANTTKFMLKNILNNRYTPIKVKISLYKQIIRPIMCYSFSTWFNITSSTMEKIRQFERKILRNINYYNDKRNCLTQNVYVDLNIKRIDYHLIHITKNYFNRNETHDNPLIRENYCTTDIICNSI